jgi:precorrin-2 dehydrogenase/sirohydrochlorin ferrochelatase
VVDHPGEGNFILPALVQRGALTLAISTAGQSPALARQLRQDLEQRFGTEYADFLELMGAVRIRLLAEGQDPGANKEKFDQLVQSELLDLVRRRDNGGVDRILRTVLGPEYSLKDLEISW